MIRTYAHLGLIGLLLTSCAAEQPAEESKVDAEPATSLEEGGTIDKPDAAHNLFRPVLVGHDGPIMDACGATAMIVTAEGGLDRVPTVRVGDNMKARPIATLEPGHLVSVCDYNDELVWTGIVFDPASPRTNYCETSSPVPDLQRYSGPCSAGWIPSSYLEMVAG